MLSRRASLILALTLLVPGLLVAQETEKKPEREFLVKFVPIEEGASPSAYVQLFQEQVDKDLKEWEGKYKAKGFTMGKWTVNVTPLEEGNSSNMIQVDLIKSDGCKCG